MRARTVSPAGRGHKIHSGRKTTVLRDIAKWPELELQLHSGLLNRRNGPAPPTVTEKTDGGNPMKIELGTISLDGASFFDAAKAVDVLNEQLQNPESKAFKAFVRLVDSGRPEAQRVRDLVKRDLEAKHNAC